MDMLADTYWNGKGLHQDWADMLHELIPTEGACKETPKLDRFRRASNLYYQLFNNGRCATHEDTLSGMLKVSGRKILKALNNLDVTECPDLLWLEANMDKIVLDAVREAGWMK